MKALHAIKSFTHYIGDRQRLLALGTVLLLVTSSVGTNSLIFGNKDKVSATTLSLCGNQGTAPAIKHVVVVMMENLSYSKVIGNPASAPYQSNTLATQCGVGTSAFGGTHTSAANYLALSAGQFPSAAPPGCGSVSTCADSSDNIYSQLDAAGLSWKDYAESMPLPCGPSTVHPYKIGHNPPPFYTRISRTECQANDLPVANLNSQSGAFWNDLQARTLPSLSWITPNEDDDGSNGETPSDTWLNGFLTNLKSSNSYQDGNTVVIVNYDEGSGSDPGVTAVGEDCTDQSQALPIVNNISAHRESCHIPFFVVYPYTAAGARDSTFFDHYSVTKTVEDLFGLPCLAHACDTGISDPKHKTNSLIGHFGLQLPVVQPPADTTPPTAPGGLAANAVSQTEIDLSWAASSDNVGVAGYAVSRDGVQIGTTTTATNFNDTGLTAGTIYNYSVSAIDAANNTSTPATISAATQAALAALSPPTDVHANAPNSSEVDLGWTAGASTVNYTIQRDGTTIGTTADTTFVDTSVSANTTYNYTVIANDAQGNTAAAAPVQAITPAAAIPIAPSAPSGLTATASSPTQVGLSWSPAIAGSAPISGYTIMRDGVAIGTTSATMYSDSNLTPSTSYSYSVTASDTNYNISAASNTATATTFAQATTKQFITNQSFETDPTPTGWTGIYSSSSSNSRVAGGFDGSFSLRSFNKTTAIATTGVIDKPHWMDGTTGKATVTGTTYTGSVWVKADTVAPNETITLFLREINASGAAVNKDPYRSGVTLPVTDTGWFNISEAYPAVGTGDSLYFYLYASNAPASKGFNADLFSLTAPN